MSTGEKNKSWDKKINPKKFKQKENTIYKIRSVFELSDLSFNNWGVIFLGVAWFCWVCFISAQTEFTV